MSDWLHGLNPEQAEAASHVDGPLLILAGAGSGKTTVLVARTGMLIDQARIPGDQIGVVTFTNKAARELKHRVSKKLGSDRGVWTGTFHRMGLEILRTWPEKAGLEKSFGVVDQSDAEGAMRELLNNVSIAGKDDFHPGILLKCVNQMKSGELNESEFQPEYLEVAEIIRPKYESRLMQLGVVDFDDLMIRPIRLMDEYPEIKQTMQQRFNYMMVDEFQDTSKIQMDLIKRLSGYGDTAGNIAVVGDDDQSIYAWRGATIDNILNFPKFFRPCRVVKLVRNYRSSPEILDVANKVIVNNKKRHEKQLLASSESGDKPELFKFDSDDQEISQIPDQIAYFQRKGYALEDIAILYRSNAMGGLCEGILRRSNLPYTITGGQGLFDRKEVKDAMAYLRCAFRPTELAFRRIINCPNRGIGEKTFEEIKKCEGRNSYHKALNYLQSHKNEGLSQLFEHLEAIKKSILSSPSNQLESVLADRMMDIGYWQYLIKNTKKVETAKQKWQAIEILGRILQSFCSEGEISARRIREFVDFMDLRDVDRDEESKGIQLLTLHACKGLEFPVVLMIGIEEDILPHKLLGSDIDEERRLFYVGVTRAKRHLVLSHCRTRVGYGRVLSVSASRFLHELSMDLFQVRESGFRPVTADQRTDLVSNFFAKLNQRIDSKGISEKKPE